MSQQVQELIDKIKSEGVQAAEQKAKEVEDQATSKAGQIVEEAHQKAERLIVEAKEEVKKIQESTHMALKQASRDTLLSLRKEINQVLQNIIAEEMKGTLSADTLITVIESVAKSAASEKSKEDIIVSVNSKDVSKLKDGFASKLQKQVKQPIKLQSSEDVGKGFTISFDNGKSIFDFTDESLAQYLGVFLNDQTASLVKDSVE